MVIYEIFLTIASLNPIFFKGIIALTLEANPQLTWRDVMFILVLTARPKAIPSNNFFANKAGFLVSSRYGFGLMDAGQMVRMATRWTTVPQFASCVADKSNVSDVDGENVNRVASFVETNGCAGTRDEVNFIEQVY